MYNKLFNKEEFSEFGDFYLFKVFIKETEQLFAAIEKYLETKFIVL